MPEIRACPDCDVPMRAGFIPDSTYGMFLQTHWHPGEAEESSFLGIATGAKIDRSAMMPVRTSPVPAVASDGRPVEQTSTPSPGAPTSMSAPLRITWT